MIIGQDDLRADRRAARRLAIDSPGMIEDVTMGEQDRKQPPRGLKTAARPWAYFLP